MSLEVEGRVAEGKGSARASHPSEELIARFAPVAAELERRSETLIDRITEVIREEIPMYRETPYRSHREIVSVHFRRGLEATRGSATATPADLAEAAAIGREAANFGIPIEALLQSIRVGVRIFWRECASVAAPMQLDPESLIGAAELIWSWADDVGIAYVRGHREAAVEEAVSVERERLGFLVEMLEGALAGPALRVGAERNGLSLDREYVPLRARAFSASRSPAHCERAIHHALGPVAQGVLLCPVEHDLIGVVPRRPVVDDPDVVMGLGQAAPIERIASSYSEAVRALEVAARFGRRGTFDLSDLSLLVSVATETALGERLVGRYLKPLRNGGASMELERTLRAYLEQGLRGERAARALPVHVNTLRNRLRRIEALTGANLRDPTVLAELWWAFQYDRLTGEVERGAQPSLSA